MDLALEIHRSSIVPFKFHCYAIMFILGGQFEIGLGHILLFSKGNV